MPHERVDVGHIELIALLDCDGEIGTMAESFPDFPAGELLAYRERYPGVYGATGGWQLKVRAWLIRHPGGVVLVDTGIGVRGAPGPTWFGAPGRLMESLHETGTPADAVDTVVISHVHDDHIGGTVTFAPAEPDGDLVASPAFPNARYLLQRADWDWEREAAERDEEDAAIVSTLLAPIQDAGLLELIEGDLEVAEGITIHHAPGHTPGHQVVRVRSQGRRAIVSADAFNHPAQFSHPDWPSGADAIHPQAALTRRALIAELLSNPGTTIAPTHFAEPFGRMKTGPDGLAGWIPL